MKKKFLWFAIAFTIIFATVGLLFNNAVALSLKDIGPGEIIIIQRTDIPTPAPAAYKIQYIETDLATLQDELSFAIMQPKDLPEGAILALVRKVTSGVEGVGAELKYTMPQGELTIKESKPANPLSISVGTSQVIRKVNINEYQGLVYDPGGDEALPQQNRAILQWTDGSLWFEVRGNIGIDAMVRIAQSLSY
jgi:hypothetical protein